MRKKIHPDPIRAYARQQTAARAVGEGAECHICHERRPKALVPGSNPTTCFECQREQRGHSTIDQHHPAGEANDPTTVSIPVNDHRARLSVDQYDWPKLTFDNTDGCPLLAGAACIRGFMDTVIYLLETLLLPKAEMLEWLHTYLVQKLGHKWWENTPLERFSPKRKRGGQT